MKEACFCLFSSDFTQKSSGRESHDEQNQHHEGKDAACSADDGINAAGIRIVSFLAAKMNARRKGRECR